MGGEQLPDILGQPDEDTAALEQAAAQALERVIDSAVRIAGDVESLEKNAYSYGATLDKIGVVAGGEYAISVKSDLLIADLDLRGSSIANELVFTQRRIARALDYLTRGVDEYSSDGQLVLEALLRLGSPCEWTAVLAPTQGDIDRLTPQFLSRVVVPYLNAVADLQGVVDDITQRERRSVSVHLIRSWSPLTVSVGGVAEAGELIRDVVTPWRRQHARAMADCEEQVGQIDIEFKKAQIIAARAKGEASRAEADQTRPGDALFDEVKEERRIAIEERRAAVEAQAVEMTEARVRLCLDIVNRLGADLSELDRATYVARLLPTIEALTASELEARPPTDGAPPTA